jgi:hypothetical protein
MAWSSSGMGSTTNARSLVGWGAGRSEAGVGWSSSVVGSTTIGRSLVGWGAGRSEAGVGIPDLLGRVSAVMKKLFEFPNPVNEVSARLVAGGVVLLTLAILVGQQPWLIGLLAYGFVARALTGPTLSPLGQLVTRVVTPSLPVAAKLVPGPPKRFAQAIGATLSVSAAVAHFGFGATTLAYVLVAMITAAATLESVFAFCLGCKIFAGLMKAGVIPESVCEECNNLGLRLTQPA